MRVVYIVSDINKALSFEWIALGLKSKFDLSFILIGKDNSEFSVFLKQHSVTVHEVSDSKCPSKLLKWWAIFSILRSAKPNVVHTHLWQANLLGLSAAWLLRIEKRLYTRHHAVIHYHEHPSGRKWDILCNFLATKIVAISQNIKNILIDWDQANGDKIELIYHGFNLDYFASVSNERVDDARRRYVIQKSSSPIIGVISRYMEWKGIQYIIPAFLNIRNQYPSAKLILANAHGSYEPTVKQLLQTLPVDSYIEIKFEQDLAALYKLFDVFIHVPVDPHVEAFGQTYVESLASGVPSIFTLSGIAAEFIAHNQNAWVVDFKNSDQIIEGVSRILADKDLRDKFKLNGLESIQRFSLDNHILALERLYRGN